LLFNFALEYSIREVQDNKEELELNGTRSFLSSLILTWAKTNIINENAEALLDASEEGGTEVNADRTKYMFMSRQQTIII
jgi:hypothetical protein